jgi:hypothetical protein
MRGCMQLCCVIKFTRNWMCWYVRYVR